MTIKLTGEFSYREEIKWGKKKLILQVECIEYDTEYLFTHIGVNTTTYYKDATYGDLVSLMNKPSTQKSAHMTLKEYEDFCVKREVAQRIKNRLLLLLEIGPDPLDRECDPDGRYCTMEWEEWEEIEKLTRKLIEELK